MGCIELTHSVKSEDDSLQQLLMISWPYYLNRSECILEAGGNQRILSKLCISLGATGILLLLNTLLLTYFISMRDGSIRCDELVALSL